jgi:hypothetical protein
MKEKCECYDAMIGENSITIKEGGHISKIRMKDIFIWKL